MSESILLSNALYRVFLGFILTFMGVLVVTSIAVTTALPSPNARYTPDPPPPTTLSTTTVLTSTTTATTTTSTSTSTSGTTTSGTTTPAPLPLNITCPPMVMVELGASLEPADTGGAPIVMGGCGNPLVPIVSYQDSVQSMTRRRSNTPRNVPQVHQITEHGFGFPAEGNLYEPRSPSFSITNAQITGTFTLDDATGTSPPDPSLAVGLNHVLHAIADETDGVRVYVSPDKVDLNNGRVFFTLRALSPDVNCSSNATNGEPQVIWDHNAQRWMVTERVGNVLCIYISNTSDPIASNWRLLSYYFALEQPERISLAVWGEYAYSFAMQSGKLCVLDRTATLNLFYDENTTLPGLFCAPSFDWPSKIWTPVHAPAESPPLATATASANTNRGSAVFMRPVDDEVDLGANTPSNDQISIEHWYSVNFTASTYSRNRYVVQVPDFNAISAGNVSTPTMFSLQADARMRLHYRWLPLRNQQSIVGSFTASLRAVWFELRWISPSMFILPLWTIHQTGSINNAWHPSITMDAGGTIGMTYSIGNATTYPSVRFATQLGNDPLGQLRVPLELHDGQVGSMIASSVWGRNNAAEPDPTVARVFFAAGARAIITDPWQETLTRVRIQSELIARNWTAQTYCPGEVVSCVQIIEAE